jgi:hypothetical protein
MTKRGFSTLPCPLCGSEANIGLDLADFGAAEAAFCPQCDGRFSLDQVQSFIDRWSAVLAWCDQAPALPE